MYVLKGSKPKTRINFTTISSFLLVSTLTYILESRHWRYIYVVRKGTLLNIYYFESHFEEVYSGARNSYINSVTYVSRTDGASWSQVGCSCSFTKDRKGQFSLETGIHALWLYKDHGKCFSTSGPYIFPKFQYQCSGVFRIWNYGC